MQQVLCSVPEFDTPKLIFTLNIPANVTFSYDLRFSQRYPSYGSVTHTILVWERWASCSCNVLVPAHYKMCITMWLEQKIVDSNGWHTFSPISLTLSPFFLNFPGSMKNKYRARLMISILNWAQWKIGWWHDINISFARANSISLKFTIQNDFPASRRFNSYSLGSS